MRTPPLSAHCWCYWCCCCRKIVWGLKKEQEIKNTRQALQPRLERLQRLNTNEAQHHITCCTSSSFACAPKAGYRCSQGLTSRRRLHVCIRLRLHGLCCHCSNACCAYWLTGTMKTNEAVPGEATALCIHYSHNTIHQEMQEWMNLFLQPMPLLSTDAWIIPAHSTKDSAVTNIASSPG